MRQDDSEQLAPAARPLPVSLVVAVRDEEDTVAALLDSIAAQTCPPAEVVIVDGGSQDGTLPLLRARAGEDARLVVVQADGPATPGRGRNLGIAASQHEWIAITDAGIRLEPTWLQRLWEAREAQPDVGVVYGSYEFDTATPFEECAAVAYGSPRRPTPSGAARGPVVPSLLVRRSVVEAAGWFPDLRAGEDEIFLRAVAASGVPSAWAPQARVWWRLRPDARSTFERFRAYSYHNARAGQQEHWHHPMARAYVPVAAALALAAATRRAEVLVLAGAPVAARVGARLWRHRADTGLLWGARPDRALRVAALVVLGDAAAALGWWQAHRSRPPRGGERDRVRAVGA